MPPLSDCFEPTATDCRRARNNTSRDSPRDSHAYIPAGSRVYMVRCSERQFLGEDVRISFVFFSALTKAFNKYVFHDRHHPAKCAVYIVSQFGVRLLHSLPPPFRRVATKSCGPYKCVKILYFLAIMLAACILTACCLGRVEVSVVDFELFTIGLVWRIRGLSGCEEYALP